MNETAMKTEFVVYLYETRLVFLSEEWDTEKVGTIDHCPEIHEHLKFGDRTFVVCFINHSKNRCGVHEIREYHGYHEGTENMVCPHCGYEDDESYDHEGDDGEANCHRCGQPFKYERHIEITYSTTKA